MGLPVKIAKKHLKPLPAEIQVPRHLHRSEKHRVYWSKRQNPFRAEQYNAVLDVFSRPCFRRWLEYTSGEEQPAYDYVTCYSPPAIESRPLRYWTLWRGKEPVCTFTNAVEGWLVLLGMLEYAGGNYTLQYVDRTG